MEKIFKNLFLLLAFCSCQILSPAQQNSTDSLGIDSATKNIERQLLEQSAKAQELSLSNANYQDKPKIAYTAACAWAMAGNKENAFKDLNLAAELGWKKMNEMAMDSDLVSLRNEKEWQELTEKIQRLYTTKEEVFYWGLFFGMLLIFFFYNFFLFISLKDKSYLYYSLLVLFDLLFELYRTPQFGIYLNKLIHFQEYFRWVSHPYELFLSLLCISYLVLTKDFMKMKELMPKMNKIANATILFQLCNIVISLLTDMPIKYVITYTVYFSYLFNFTIGVVAWIRGYKQARFFVLGGAVLSVSMLILFLHQLRVSELGFNIGYLRLDNVGFILFFGILSFALADRITILKREKEGAQEKALEVLEEKVQERTFEVVKQKEIIEEKNKEITDSINYAQRIQNAKLPRKEEIYAALPQSFVLFQPKDIVSGDFYFFHSSEKGLTFIAAADCTGHGVPGALMSMIGSEKLEDAVSRSSNPSEILQILNKSIKSSLRQTSSDESTRDGMDIAFCAIDIPKRNVKYSGANRPLWIIRKGGTEVEEIKGTKKAIGGLTEDDQHFDSHEVQMQQGDSIYIFSDGFADLFGKAGKKLTTKKFRQILLDIQQKSMKEQEKYLEDFAKEWKSGTEQIDDVLVIGIRF